MDNFYVEHITSLGEQHSRHLRCRPIRTEFAKVIGQQPILKLLIAATDQQEREWLLELEKEFEEVNFAYAKMEAQPEWLFASIISPAACKRQAFAQLLEYHRVGADQVVAFGDAQSDKIFLELAGLGVAMGNSSADVQAVATLVTEPVWNDGVARTLDAIALAKHGK